MPSRAGKPNKYRQNAIDLAQKKGVSVLQAQVEILADLMGFYRAEVGKPRAERAPNFSEVEDKVIRVTQNLMPYMLPRLGQLNVETNMPASVTVIRAPEKAASPAEWLAKFAPQRDDLVNERPAAASEAIQRLQATYKMAEAIGVDSASAVIKQAASRDEPNAEFTAAPNRKMLRHYD
jgi:hypothetical protein